jgi:hypothetical protein
MPFETRFIPDLCGWRGDFPSRPRVAASFRRLADLAPHLLAAPRAADVFLFRAWKEVLGSYPAYVRQEIGDCTSFGSAHVTDCLQCVEIAIGHESESFKEICTEAIYGMGRAIGGMLGSGDGCYGAAVAKAVMEGVVPRELVGPYSGRRAKEWGSTGVPAEIAKAAKDHAVGATALVSSLDEASAALSNGYPYIICSDQGFTMTRDASGACTASGTWQHCMSVVGMRTQSAKAEFLICQSWGPNVPSGPLMDDQPDFSFWCSSATMARILAQGDSFAFSKFTGFPGRPLPSAWSYGTFI